MADASLSGPDFGVPQEATVFADRIRRELAAAAREDRPPALDFLRRSCDAFHQRVFAAEGNPRPTCRRGCSTCCEQLVFDVSAHEIADIGRHLVSSGRAAGIRTALRARVELYDATRRETERAPGASSDDFEERVALAFWARRSPCVFLDSEGACSIHERRPFTCRSFFVLGSAELCRAPHAADAERQAFVLEPFAEFHESMIRTNDSVDFDPDSDRLDLALLRWLEANAAI